MKKTYSLFYISIVLLFVSIPIVHSCMTFRMSPAEVSTFFEEKDIDVLQQQYTKNFRKIHYVQTADTTKPLVLFVHGSPGSASAFIDFLTDSALLTRAMLITTDRPGFGYSNFGVAEPSLKAQAQLLASILEKHRNNRPITLVGHSLGGPVVARIAMDFPHLVDGLILVAASIDPDLEPNETWFRAPLATPFLSWLLPRSLRASNEEIYQLKPQLKQMLPLWQKITCPVWVIQGKKDSLVPPANADFAAKMLSNTSVKIVYKDEMNHFVPWTNPELIRNAIIESIKYTSKKSPKSPSEYNENETEKTE